MIFADKRPNFMSTLLTVFKHLFSIVALFENCETSRSEGSFTALLTSHHSIMPLTPDCCCCCCAIVGIITEGNVSAAASVFPLLFSNDNYYTLESGSLGRPHIEPRARNPDHRDITENWLTSAEMDQVILVNESCFLHLTSDRSCRFPFILHKLRQCIPVGRMADAGA